MNTLLVNSYYPPPTQSPFTNQSCLAQPKLRCSFAPQILGWQGQQPFPICIWGKSGIIAQSQSFLCGINISCRWGGTLSNSIEKEHGFPRSCTPSNLRREFYRFQFLLEGKIPPYPHLIRQYCRHLAGTACTCNRGLHSPHSVDHTETLTPPIVRQDKRFTFGHNQLGRCGPLGIFMTHGVAPKAHRQGRRPRVLSAP